MIPAGCLTLPAGRRHNLRLRQWQIGRAIAVLTDKATLAGITVHLVNERGTSSTCPACHTAGTETPRADLVLPALPFAGHRDLVAAATIATRAPGGGPTTPAAVMLPEVVTHRRAGRHLPGAGQSRRDPRRPPTTGGARISWPAEARPTTRWGVARPTGEDPQHPPKPGER